MAQSSPAPGIPADEGGRPAALDTRRRIGQTGAMRNLIPPCLAVLTALCFAACDDEPTPDAAVADSGAAEDDAAVSDTAPADSPDAVRDAAPPDVTPPDAAPPDELMATEYCERAVDVFCPYYVRCGRMAVADEAECRAVFVESCNAKYEPTYAAHARAGELVLSRAGLDACRAHLDAVDCAAHNFDLDGPCGAIWPGQVAASGTCGPGIGSFVCGAGTDCRLSVETFCGTCEPVAAIGEPCGDEARCHSSGECRDGACAARPTAGQPCADDGPRCATGTSCQNGTCTMRPWAGPGEACGQAARCRYKSDCIGGVCVEGALLGAACGAEQPCATGWCDGGSCALPKVAGSACGAHAECVSGGCVDGLCIDDRGPCFIAQ